MVLAQQAWSAFPPLNWAVAVPAADESLRLARETGQPLWEASALIVQAILAGVRGDFDEAESQIAAAESIALPMGANAMLCGIQLTRGLTAVGAGRYDEAFEQLHRLFDTNDPAYHHFQSAWALGDLAEAALHTDNLEAARAQLEIFELTLTDRRVHLDPGLAALRQDLSLPTTPTPRLCSTGTARKPLHVAPLPSQVAVELRPLAASPTSRGRLPRSSALRTEAFDALGASAFAEQARVELRAAGERSHGAETHAWQDLSPQELHIARLAADGLSNREIGARLYLSHRTVASHLYRVYPKLEITSRVQLRPTLDQLTSTS